MSVWYIAIVLHSSSYGFAILIFIFLVALLLSNQGFMSLRPTFRQYIFIRKLNFHIFLIIDGCRKDYKYLNCPLNPDLLTLFGKKCINFTSQLFWIDYLNLWLILFCISYFFIIRENLNTKIVLVFNLFNVFLKTLLGIILYCNVKIQLKLKSILEFDNFCFSKASLYYII